MKLFKVTAKSNINSQGAQITKGMSVEVNTSLSSPFNNSSRDTIAAFVRKYGIDDSRLTSLSSSYFKVEKIS